MEKVVRENQNRMALDPFEFFMRLVFSSAYDQDPDPQKYVDPWIRIQGVKYQPKTTKINFFTPKTQICTYEKNERL